MHGQYIHRRIVPVGFAVGEVVGSSVGLEVDVAIGTRVGLDIGTHVGFDVGESMGKAVGLAIGARVGFVMGVGVSFAVGEVDILKLNTNVFCCKVSDQSFVVSLIRCAIVKRIFLLDC
jgi:hypothetical protein